MSTPAPPEVPLSPGMERLAVLLGTWSGRGHGEYPTIDPFEYDETVGFSHVGKPFVAYSQRTADPGSGRPLHAEVGYLRVARGSWAELVVAHPTGIVELSEGTFDGPWMRLRSRVVAGTGTAKEVTAIERDIFVEGDVLEYSVRMAAVGVPLTHHLRARLERVR